MADTQKLTWRTWVEPQVAKWVEGVEALAKVAVRFPQAAYTGFAHCLQAEWQYLSHCVPAWGRSWPWLRQPPTTS